MSQVNTHIFFGFLIEPASAASMLLRIAVLLFVYCTAIISLESLLPPFSLVVSREQTVGTTKLTDCYS
jgi:hypothetical protein